MFVGIERRAENDLGWVVEVIVASVESYSEGLPF